MRTIFFDIDDTLINHQYAQNTAALLFQQQFASSLSYSSEEFCQLWQTAMQKHFATFMQGKISFVEHRRRRIREIFENDKLHLSDEEAERFFEVYLQYYEDNWLLFSDVVPCLDVLSNYQLGIISNGNREQQIKKLSHTGILDRFDVVVISEEVGVSKPAPDIFLAACCQAKVRVEDCVLVGDSLQNDVLGALAVGMPAIWVNRANLPNDELTALAIANLDYLPSAIEIIAKTFPGLSGEKL